jgi:hypothetical protein
VPMTDEGHAAEPVARGDATGQWCGQCGEALVGGIPDSGGGAVDHRRCLQRAALEPPRWCVHCRRRMVVQVTPAAWTATCSRHGTVEQPTWH